MAAEPATQTRLDRIWAAIQRGEASARGLARDCGVGYQRVRRVIIGFYEKP